MQRSCVDLLPVTLRWNSADPLYNFLPEMGLNEPQRLNLYAFSMNNPVRYYDADGRAPKDDDDDEDAPESDDCESGGEDSGKCGDDDADETDSEEELVFEESEVESICGPRCQLEEAVNRANQLEGEQIDRIADQIEINQKLTRIQKPAATKDIFKGITKIFLGVGGAMEVCAGSGGSACGLAILGGSAAVYEGLDDALSKKDLTPAEAEPYTSDIGALKAELRQRYENIDRNNRRLEIALER